MLFAVRLIVLNWLNFLQKLNGTKLGALEHSSWESLGVLNPVACISDGTSRAPRAETVGIATIRITESSASGLFVFKLGHQEWGLSVAHKIFFKMTSAELVHLTTFSSVVWVMSVYSLHNFMNVVTLMGSIEAHKSNKDES